MLVLIACSVETPTTLPVRDTGPFDRDGDGWTALHDCDDARASTHPEAVEACNGRDDDCDDQLDEGEWYVDEDGDGQGDDSTLADSIECRVRGCAGRQRLRR